MLLMKKERNYLITCIFTQLNNGFSSICWSKRPGVHITMLHWSIRFLSNFKSFPPITRPAEISWCWPTLRSVSYIWYASSLVGVIINAPRPSNLDHCLQYKASKACNKITHRLLYIILKIYTWEIDIVYTGIRKANVLPLPVFAAPKISLPCKARPMLCLWMSVIST